MRSRDDRGRLPAQLRDRAPVRGEEWLEILEGPAESFEGPPAFRRVALVYLFFRYWAAELMPGHPRYAAGERGLYWRGQIFRAELPKDFPPERVIDSRRARVARP